MVIVFFNVLFGDFPSFCFSRVGIVNGEKPEIREWLGWWSKGDTGWR